MEITITANVHYKNGRNEHFIRQTSLVINEKLYSLFYGKTKELESCVGFNC